MNIWKTKEQIEKESIEYNPKIVDNMKNDPDYCIRGMVSREDGLFAELGDYRLELIQNGLLEAQK